MEEFASDAEFSWTACQEAAPELLRSGQKSVACEQWRIASAIADQFGERDPRRATSLNNLGIALRIEGDYSESERLYRAAESAWEDAALWIEDMRLEPRARSAPFHRRLEARHAGTYNALVLAAYQHLLPAGHAITLHNLGELFESLGRTSQARYLYVQAYDMRSTAMDDAESLARRMRANFHRLSREPAEPAVQPPTPSSAFAYTDVPFSAQAAKMRWVIDQPPELTDEGRLMAAILCAQMLDPQWAVR